MANLETGMPPVPAYITTRGVNTSYEEWLAHKQSSKLTKQEKRLFFFTGEDSLSNVRRYIRIGVNVNAQDEGGTTVLMKASYWGRTRIVKLLLAVDGINVNAQDNRGNTALIGASYCGRLDVVELLASKGAV